ncbi:MAG TPA: response regulator transcription factor [Opitutaceae bacterium]|nr:response regulator transcription factor [Opitutaceae bacterium]
MKKIRLLLVDDQSLFREALRTLLSLQPDFDIAAEAADGEQAIAAAAKHRPDVVLMDLRMPVLNGVEATRRIAAAGSGGSAPRVIVLTTFDEDAEVFEALRAGAVGYLLKASSAEKLYGAVRAAAQGATVFDPSIAAKLMAGVDRSGPREPRRPAPPLADALSARELEVLRFLTEGCSNKEIGARLRISEGTVKNHMTNVLGKLGVLDRTQAALRARKLGLI